MKHIQQLISEVPLVTMLQGYHVTDYPQTVTTVLQQGMPIDRGQDVSLYDDLLASGLYFSQAPQLWVGRSARKWDFAENLTKAQRVQIVETVAKDSRFAGEWYLTSAEKERAKRYLELFAETGKAVYLELLADQPFNIQTWKRGFLSPLGIVNDHVPYEVPVKVEGALADVNDMRLSSALVIALKHAGYDGMFVLSSIAILPQAVVWNNHAIVQFGEYHKDQKAGGSSRATPLLHFEPDEPLP